MLLCTDRVKSFQKSLAPAPSPERKWILMAIHTSEGLKTGQEFQVSTGDSGMWFTCSLTRNEAYFTPLLALSHQ